MCSSSSAGHEAGEGAGAAAEISARAAGQTREVQRAGKTEPGFQKSAAPPLISFDLCLSSITHIPYT